MPQARRPVGTSFEQQLDLLGATSSTDPSAETWQLLASVGHGRGEQLDALLGGLGDAYIEDGEVRWDAPAGLDHALVGYLSRSVDELNARLRAGELTLDQRGNIRPPTVS
ncbi:MAG TPA: hypothetical protein VI357_16185 [Mycobacteriales bacterium]